MRVCPKPGCPTLIPAGSRYCSEHERAYDRARGTKRERGYGPEHRRLRAAIVASMQAGETIRCLDCGIALTPTTFDLGHTDDRTGYRGALCARCNRADGGRRSHQTPGG